MEWCFNGFSFVHFSLFITFAVVTILSNMRKLFFALLLCPMCAFAQTSTQKVLYMKVVRTNGTLTARLDAGEDFLGPVYNPSTKRLFIKGGSRTLSSIKEIRFEIQEEEITDAVSDVRMDDSDSQKATVYDLSGRKIDSEKLAHGIYIKKGKKFIKQ